MWTDAAIETLRQMAIEGKSASVIAAALGAPSRNAVIGKANRIGIKLTGNMKLPQPVSRDRCWSGPVVPPLPVRKPLGDAHSFPLCRASGSPSGFSPKRRLETC